MKSTAAAVKYSSISRRREQSQLSLATSEGFWADRFQIKTPPDPDISRNSPEINPGLTRTYQYIPGVPEEKRYLRGDRDRGGGGCCGGGGA